MITKINTSWALSAVWGLDCSVPTAEKHPPQHQQGLVPSKHQENKVQAEVQPRESGFRPSESSSKALSHLQPRTSFCLSCSFWTKLHSFTKVEATGLLETFRFSPWHNPAKSDWPVCKNGRNEGKITHITTHVHRQVQQWTLGRKKMATDQGCHHNEMVRKKNPLRGKRLNNREAHNRTESKRTREP